MGSNSRNIEKLSFTIKKKNRPIIHTYLHREILIRWFLVNFFIDMLKYMLNIPPKTKKNVIRHFVDNVKISKRISEHLAFLFFFFSFLNTNFISTKTTKPSLSDCYNISPSQFSSFHSIEKFEDFKFHNMID